MSDALVVGKKAPTLKAQPLFGLPVETATGRPMVVLFLRDLAGSTTRATVNHVHAAIGRFEAAAIPIVALTRTPLADARDFVPRHHLLFPVIVDESGEHFAAWQVGRDAWFSGTLRHLKPSQVRAVVGSLSNGRGLPRAPFDQLPAFFAIKADGTLAYARYADSVVEQPDLDAIWAALAE